MECVSGNDFEAMEIMEAKGSVVNHMFLMYVSTKTRICLRTLEQIKQKSPKGLLVRPTIKKNPKRNQENPSATCWKTVRLKTSQLTSSKRLPTPTPSSQTPISSVFFPFSPPKKTQKNPQKTTKHKKSTKNTKKQQKINKKQQNTKNPQKKTQKNTKNTKKNQKTKHTKKHTPPGRPPKNHSINTSPVMPSDCPVGLA